jgi:hypothetical protein
MGIIFSWLRSYDTEEYDELSDESLVYTMMDPPSCHMEHHERPIQEECENHDVATETLDSQTTLIEQKHTNNIKVPLPLNLPDKEPQFIPLRLQPKYSNLYTYLTNMKSFPYEEVATTSCGFCGEWLEPNVWVYRLECGHYCHSDANDCLHGNKSVIGWYMELRNMCCCPTPLCTYWARLAKTPYVFPVENPKEQQ